MSSEALNGDSTNSDEMNVGAVMERLGAYVDGELSPAEREAVEVLLQEDKSFLNAVRSFRWLDDVARQEDVAPVSGKEWARIWESIERMKEEPLSAPRAYISAEDTNHGQKLVLSGRFFLPPGRRGRDSGSRVHRLSVDARTRQRAKTRQRAEHRHA